MKDEERIVKTWPEYSVAGVLGHGTYGTVYHVHRRDMPDMDAAVKAIGIPTDENDVQALRADGFSEEQIAAFFAGLAEDWKNEIHLMKRYQGMSHFVSIEDCKLLEREDVKYGKWILIRMEKLKSLPAYLSDKTLTEGEVIDLGQQICEALQRCHADGMIHRDIKPENIFVQDRNASGVLYKLGDFGATKRSDSLSSSFAMKGAVAYMAPEILQTRQYDARADIYSLGLTLYRLMNGNRLPFLPARQLFSHEDYDVATRMRLNGMQLPPAADASAAFNQVLAKACAFDPEDRYPSAEAFSKALAALSAPVPDGKKPLRFVLPAALCLILAAALIWLRLWDRRIPVSDQTPIASSSIQKEGATAVPMLTAQVVPDPIRQALDDALDSWQQVCTGPEEGWDAMSECPAFPACIAAAPALSRDADSGVLSLDHRGARQNLHCIDEAGKEFAYTYDPALQGYVFRNIVDPEPETIRAYKAELTYTIGGRRWQIFFTYQPDPPFQVTECEIRLVKDDSGIPELSWYAQRNADGWDCLLTFQRNNQPALLKRYSIQDRRTGS